MEYILISASFDAGSISGEKLASLIELTVGFNPTHIITDDFLKSGGNYDPKTHLQKIKNSHTLSMLSLGFPEYKGSKFAFSRISVWGIDVVYWTLDTINDLPQDFLDELSSWQGLNAIYLSDAEDVHWQSESFISSFITHGKPYRHLIKVWDEDFEEYRIDISKNPGARHALPHMWLQSAPFMWFCNRAFDYFPRRKLLDFPYASEIREISSSGSVFIKLYSNLHDCEKRVNRKVQRAFRDWMGFSSLISQASDLTVEDTGVDDVVSIDIQEGNFPNGGVRLVTSWLDENNQPIGKRNSKYCLKQEFNLQGDVIWSEKVPSIKFK